MEYVLNRSVNGSSLSTHQYLLCLFVLTVLFLPVPSLAERNVIHIYQDADLTHHSQSSEAIQQGIKIAFDEIGGEINGYEIEYKFLDHRGNVARSKKNYQTFIDDPKALSIFSGLHSPPLIKNRAFINQNSALTLVPWAAGGPITRYPSKQNWVFRLSIDDTQAAPVIIEFALKEQGCKSPHLLLEASPWGDSNLKSMLFALIENGIENTAISRFSLGLGSQGAREFLRKISNVGSDCIILVGNSVEGSVIVKEIVEMPMQKRLPVISHWGITGGNFHNLVTSADRNAIELHFIQTCFAFTNPDQNELARRVFSHLGRFTNGMISEPQDLESAVGFIHAYDLTKIFIQAVKQVTLSGDMDKDRNAVRLALENIQQPVYGLVKTYQSPFSEFSAVNNVDAHEALHKADYCMGKYGNDNEILISQSEL